MMEDAVDKRKRFDSLLLNPSISQIHDVCTRWGVNDPANWVMKNQRGLDCLKLSVWKSPGVPWFPQFFTPDVLEQIREKYGPVDWSLLYMNEAISSDACEFDPDLLRKYEMAEDPAGEKWLFLEKPEGIKKVALSTCNVFQVIDAGLTRKSTDARTANVVWAITPPTPTEPFELVLLEAKATHSDPNQVIEEANASYEKWNPMIAALEVFGGHIAFYYWALATYPKMRLIKLPTDTSPNAKDNRIRGFWGAYPRQGRVYVHRRTSTDAVDELTIFPNGKTKDLIDAGAYLPKIWVPPDAVDAHGNPTRKKERGDKVRRPTMSEDDEAALGETQRGSVCGY